MPTAPRGHEDPERGTLGVSVRLVVRTWGRHLVGVVLLLLVVFIWVGGSELMQYVFLEDGFAKPFFLTYCSTSTLSVYLLIAALKALLLRVRSLLSDPKASLSAAITQVNRKRLNKSSNEEELRGLVSLDDDGGEEGEEEEDLLEEVPLDEEKRDHEADSGNDSEEIDIDLSTPPADEVISTANGNVNGARHHQTATHWKQHLAEQRETRKPQHVIEEEGEDISRSPTDARTGGSSSSCSSKSKRRARSRANQDEGGESEAPVVPLSKKQVALRSPLSSSFLTL